jgi:hypothetical protein
MIGHVSFRPRYTALSGFISRQCTRPFFSTTKTAIIYALFLTGFFFARH